MSSGTLPGSRKIARLGSPSPSSARPCHRSMQNRSYPACTSHGPAMSWNQERQRKQASAFLFLGFTHSIYISAKETVHYFHLWPEKNARGASHFSHRRLTYRLPCGQWPQTSMIRPDPVVPISRINAVFTLTSGSNQHRLTDHRSFYPAYIRSIGSERKKIIDLLYSLY
jgi:hypothetical protein